MLAHRSGHSISPWGLQMGGGNPALDSGFGNSSLSVAARVEARRKRTLKRVNTFVIRRHLLFVSRLAFVLPLQSAVAVAGCH